MEDNTATLTCERHGNATPLSCVRCETPICWGCLVETDVGFMCEKHGGRQRRSRMLPSDRRQRLVAGAGALAAVLLVVYLARQVGDGGTDVPAPRPVVYQAISGLIDNPGFEAGAGEGGTPAGWQVRGGGYEAGVDPDVRHTGTASGRVRSLDVAARNRLPSGLISCFGADRVVGGTLRMRGYMRSDDVSGSLTGLFIEVSGERFDGSQGRVGGANMGGFPIRGTTAWREYTLQVPVAVSAERVCVGALLTGGGTIWLDDVVLELTGGPGT